MVLAVFTLEVTIPAKSLPIAGYLDRVSSAYVGVTLFSIGGIISDYISSSSPFIVCADFFYHFYLSKGIYLHNLVRSFLYFYFSCLYDLWLYASLAGTDFL